MTLTHVDLFAGIGGFSLALQRAGAKTVAAVEIDKHCQKVLGRHFPEAKIFPDVCDITSATLTAAGFVPSRGVITAGWPCQGNSVAGRRAGLGDARSGLWSEVYRILDENRPAYFIGENVPGLLSVNKGRDIRLILNDLNDLGYFVNMDILDAQFFGVPQRRRRLFFVCQRVDHILQRKTTSSALIIAQVVSEILRLILDVANPPLPIGRRNSGSAKMSSVDGLRMRMKLFELDAEPSAWANLLSYLDDGLARSQHGPENSGLPLVEKGERSQAADTSLVDWKTVNTSSSIEWSWSDTWAALCEATRSCTTSTLSRPITESTIYSCARMLLSISERIDLSMTSSPTFSPAASSISIALTEFINYARQSSRQVPNDLAGNSGWTDFIRPAECSIESLQHLGDSGRASAEILFERQGVSGDSAEGCEAGAEAAGATRASAENDRGRMTVSTLQGGGQARLSDRRRGSSGRPLADPVAALTANGVGTCGADDNQAQAGHLVVDISGSPSGP
ncbi:DNA methylase [Mycobacterium phage KashFlow]|nr:DNA methylase [Mycobacterium phage KashFlow]